MKRLSVFVVTLLLAGSLSFAQTGGTGSADKGKAPASDDSKKGGKKGGKKSGKKGGKKSKKSDKGDAAAPPK
jgi:hypothetical protein